MTTCDCAINEVLIRLMCEKIKTECGKMIEAGATIEQVNSVLPDMLIYYEGWRRETLNEVMRAFDDPNQPSHDPTPLTPLRMN